LKLSKLSNSDFQKIAKLLISLVRLVGIEPTTLGFGGHDKEALYAILNHLRTLALSQLT
jgi:hypothetical protein